MNVPLTSDFSQVRYRSLAREVFSQLIM